MQQLAGFKTILVADLNTQCIVKKTALLKAACTFNFKNRYGSTLFLD